MSCPRCFDEESESGCGCNEAAGTNKDSVLADVKISQRKGTAENCGSDSTIQGFDKRLEINRSSADLGSPYCME